MQLHFFGAAGEVTGSNTLVETSTKPILIDCGVFQGEKMVEERNYDPFPYNPSEVQAVLLTHAHLDHCGRLPKLYHHGFRGKIYATNATRDLTMLSLQDSAELIAEEAAEHHLEPFFTVKDVDHLLPLFEPAEYGQLIKIDDNTHCRFQEAGHILGSACIELWVNREKVVFSGDLGNYPVPILRPPSRIDSAQTVVLEATYGHEVHEAMTTRRRSLKEAIDYITRSHGVLMIPAFALQRTQEILYELNYLAEHNLIPDIPFFIDSPLAIEATDIFNRYSKYFNPDARQTIAKGDNLFQFPGLKNTLTVAQSIAINDIAPPKVIIAGSGMLNGGRIRHHLKRYISVPENYLLLVGYQVAGTLGRQLLDGAKKIHLFDEPYHVRAEVKSVSAFSAHADQRQLLRWLSVIGDVQTVYLNHGEEKQLNIMAKLIKENLNLNVTIAKEELTPLD